MKGLNVSRILKWSPVWIAALLVACGGQVSIGAGGAAVGAGANMGDSYKKEIEEWHTGRIKRLTADDGWLTLVGLFPLPNGAHTFGSAADNELVFPAGSPAHGGTFVVLDSTVTMKPASGVEMTLGGKSVGEMALASDRNDAGPSKIQMGSIQFYVIARSRGLYLRVKDANSPVHKNFKSIDRFTVSKKWCFDAVFERYNPPHLIKIPNVLGYEDNVPCPGALAFEKDGKTYRLEVLAQEGDELEIVFGDKSSGQDTYGGGREVYVAMPGPDNKTVLDFNKAYNPPCVFTTFATCPLPHRENVLPFRVEAGEKAYGDPIYHARTGQ
jgi:uncharacterized protein (DUF1684 family)